MASSSTFRRYFGQKTTWYLQEYTTFWFDLYCGFGGTLTVYDAYLSTGKPVGALYPRG